MKKILAIILEIVLVISLVSCSGNTSIAKENSASTKNEDEATYTAYTYNGEPTDLFTVEEVVLMPECSSNGEIYLKWKVKVRNTSGEDIPMKEASMRIFYRYLDKNEDSLFDQHATAGYSSTIKNDRAEWITVNFFPPDYFNEDTMKSIEYIEIFGYTNTLHGYPDYEFKNPVVVKVSDYVDWDKIINK